MVFDYAVGVALPTDGRFFAETDERQPDGFSVGREGFGNFTAREGFRAVTEQDIGFELPAVEGAQNAPLNLEDLIR